MRGITSAAAAAHGLVRFGGAVAGSVRCGGCSEPLRGLGERLGRELDKIYNAIGFAATFAAEFLLVHVGSCRQFTATKCT